VTITTQSNEKDVPAVPLQIELRDWFAGQALAGCLASDMDPSAAVRTAWLTADAMLAARKGARDE
jgi:hypothetical protein